MPTRSGKVPIVLAYVKVMLQMQIPIILHMHEAPYMPDSDVTMLSEYQVREHSFVIDSVPKRHKSVDGASGTQRMVLSEHLHVPFVDRGGLLGCEILDRSAWFCQSIYTYLLWTGEACLDVKFSSGRKAMKVFEIT